MPYIIILLHGIPGDLIFTCQANLIVNQVQANQAKMTVKPPLGGVGRRV
jgi:hypothetical protein